MHGYLTAAMIFCKDTDQFSAACLSADDGLHDELPKGSLILLQYKMHFDNEISNNDQVHILCGGR